MHPAIKPGRVAVITGGASGIGLATARRLVAEGMQVVLADRDEDQLKQAAAELGSQAIAVPTDVARLEEVARLHEQALSLTGDIAIVMNNAGTGGGGASAFADIDGWQRILGVNLWGVIHGLQTFVPGMIASGKPAAVINTGSKQGITNPPGGAAYNVSKAGIRSVTEHLAHELREIEDCQVTAHLLIPGFTYTGMIRRFAPEKPPGAWEPAQVAEALLTRMASGDFYIVCPDNDVTPGMDMGRMLWHTGDIVENRPALSRWHRDHAEAFNEFMKEYM
ncbi:MAG: SDR family NAD(P)-dependent oxidoreductase [Proteobacteria bacterium]|nr:SDR family NAD(P)-dependent oxidoreductase [Pseudomonadota bacterium]